MINMYGIVPYTFTPTSHIAVTFGLSLTTFIEYFNLGKMEDFKLSENIKYNILYDRLVTLLCIFTFICCYPHGVLKGFFAILWALNIHGNLFFTFDSRLAGFQTDGDWAIRPPTQRKPGSVNFEIATNSYL